MSSDSASRVTAATSANSNDLHQVDYHDLAGAVAFTKSFFEDLPEDSLGLLALQIRTLNIVERYTIHRHPLERGHIDYQTFSDLLYQDADTCFSELKALNEKQNFVSTAIRNDFKGSIAFSIRWVSAILEHAHDLNAETIINMDRLMQDMFVSATSYFGSLERLQDHVIRHASPRWQTSSKRTGELPLSSGVSDQKESKLKENMKVRLKPGTIEDITEFARQVRKPRQDCVEEAIHEYLIRREFLQTPTPSQ